MSKIKVIVSIVISLVVLVTIRAGAVNLLVNNSNRSMMQAEEKCQSSYNYSDCIQNYTDATIQNNSNLLIASKLVLSVLVIGVVSYFVYLFFYFRGRPQPKK